MDRHTRSLRSALLPVIGALFLAPGCVEPVHVEHDWTAMGFPAHAELYMATRQDADGSLADIVQHVETVEATMGYGVEGSELTRLNAEASDGYYSVQDRDLYRLVKLALDYAQVSRGTFDPSVAPIARLYEREGGRVPSEHEIDLTLARVGWDRVAMASEARAVHFRTPGMELDLGAVLKGYALDMAARAFARSGTHAARLSLGNTQYVWNAPPDRDAWTVVLPDPRSPNRTLGTVEVANQGISVLAHVAGAPSWILDARVGRPSSTDLLAAVGFADTAADAEALTAAMFVAGSAAGGELVARMVRVQAILVVAGDGKPYALASATLKGRFTPSPELSAEIGDRVRYILAPQTLDLAGQSLLGS